MDSLFRSSRSLQSPPEVRAVDPHAVQDDGDLTGYRDGAAAALGLHQPYAPGLAPEARHEKMVRTPDPATAREITFAFMRAPDLDEAGYARLLLSPG